MDIRKIKENLGRVKIYYLKGETLRALGFAIMGLREAISSNPPTEVRSLIREAVQYLSRDAELKAVLEAPLAYQPGQEKQLLIVLTKAYKQLEAAAKQEERAQTLARKQRLDQSLLQGQKLLELGKTSEADASFQEAVKNYRDEHRLFQLIGAALLNAQQPRRAYPYLKKAVEVEPDNQTAKSLFEQAAAAREANA